MGESSEIVRDIESCVEKRTYVGGNAGRKDGVIIDGNDYIIKYPQSTKTLVGKNLPSYTTSPLSEYIGSHIYELLGIPVHETILAKRENKLVVACKVFTKKAPLREFGVIKNFMNEEKLEGTNGSDAHGEILADVLETINIMPEFAPVRTEALRRFWDMFVVDAFILNNDRNNGNWGLLDTDEGFILAPVYDNGNAFFNKRDTSLMEKRLENLANVKNDVSTYCSFYIDDTGAHIKPFEYVISNSNPALDDALINIGERLKAGVQSEIHALIDSIPTTAYGIEVMPTIMKDFYHAVINIQAEKIIQAALERRSL